MSFKASAPKGTTSSLGLVREQTYDAQSDFGFVGDLVTTNGTSSMGAGTATLTDTSNPFTAADVGKRITVPRAGAGAGVNAAQLTTTILTFVGAGNVTLAASSTNAVTNISVSYGTDNTAAITAMNTLVNTTNASFPGVTIKFGQSQTNAYGFPTPVTFNKQVQIEGIGGAHTTDSGDYTRIGGTRLAWWGTSSDGGTAFQGFWNVNPTGVQSLKHTSFRRCWVDCRNNDQNQALFGLKMASIHGNELEDFFVMDALAAAIRTDIATSPSGDAADFTRFLWMNICIRQLDNQVSPAPMTTPILMTSAVVLTTTPQSLTVAANTLPTAGYFWTATTIGAPILVNYTGGGGTTTLTGCTIATEYVVHTPTTVNGGNVVQATPGNGACTLMGGGTLANTCCSSVQQAQFSHGTTWGPAAVETWNSDSVEWDSCYVNGGNATNDGAINRIRKPGYRFNSSIVSSTLASRNQNIQGGSAGAGGLSVMGLLNTSALVGFPAGPIYSDLYQCGNAEPVPTREAVTLTATQGPAGGSLDWSMNGGWRPGIIGPVGIAVQTITGVATALVAGTLCPVPPQAFQIGTMLRWSIPFSKTAAGTAARVVAVKYGAAGSTADGTTIATASFTPTAVADQGVLVIDLVVTSLGAAATALCQMYIQHTSATAVGWGVSAITATMATFDSTAPGTAPRFLHVDISVGTAEVLSVLMPTTVMCLHPGNP